MFRVQNFFSHEHTTMPRGTQWVFTWNNYTEEDAASLMTGNLPLIKYITFQSEVGGRQGTPHLQGYLETIKQSGKKELNEVLFRNQAWIGAKAPKATVQESIAYTRKDDTFDAEANIRYEWGTPRSGAKGHRSDLDAVQQAINDGRSYDEICDEHFSVAARADRFIKERIAARDKALQHEELRAAMEGTVLWTWQNNLLNMLTGAPHPRQIYWIYEEVGNKGKSFMGRYMATMHGALILEAGRKVDLAHIFVTTIPTPGIVIFDLSRTAAPHDDGVSRGSPVDVVYSLMESLKNGYIIATKYESKGLSFKVPHVVVFANFAPDRSKMSEDRWNVNRIVGNNLVSEA